MELNLLPTEARSSLIPRVFASELAKAHDELNHSYESSLALYGSPAAAMLCTQGLLDGWSWSPVYARWLKAQRAAERGIYYSTVGERFELLSSHVPSPSQRAHLRKMFALQCKEIGRHADAGRLVSAAWLTTTTWIMAICFLASKNLGAVLRAVKRAMGLG
jgi:hypothetical protein